MPLELKLITNSDDFLDMGLDLMNPKFGPRHLEYSDNKEEYRKGWCRKDIENYKGGWPKGLAEFYIGERSSKLKGYQHGRGILITAYFIYIGYFNYGRKTGKNIKILNEGSFEVG
jgi:hypothetical protein